MGTALLVAVEESSGEKRGTPEVLNFYEIFYSWAPGGESCLIRHVFCGLCFRLESWWLGVSHFIYVRSLFAGSSAVGGIRQLFKEPQRLLCH